jgi:hypothetical protein
MGRTRRMEVITTWTMIRRNKLINVNGGGITMGISEAKDDDGYDAMDDYLVC